MRRFLDSIAAVAVFLAAELVRQRRIQTVLAAKVGARVDHTLREVNLYEHAEDSGRT